MTRSGLIRDVSRNVCASFKKEFIKFTDSAIASQEFMDHLDIPCNVCGDALDIVLNFDVVQMRKLADTLREGHTPATRLETKVSTWMLTALGIAVLIGVAVVITVLC